MTFASVRWPTPHGRPPLAATAVALGLPTLLLLTSSLIELEPSRLSGLASRLLPFLLSFLTMPDWSYLPELGHKLVETFQITLLSSSLALVLSLPLAFLAATNSSPHPVLCRLVRAALSFVRALPELLWALIFVSALGLGALPGVLALAAVTVGFLAKFFAESIEVVDVRPLEGVRACGANALQLRVFGMLPQALPDFVGTTLYMLDHNIRAAAILGLVGAGGIGYDMVTAMRLFAFDRLILIMLAIYLAVTALDRCSQLLRRRLI
jgi:phosphonate transport system permease protein